MARAAICILKNGSQDFGFATFTQADGDPLVHIDLNLKGLTPGKHGMHVHEFGDTTRGCESAGDHFNPFGKQHGGRMSVVRHVGDLGNVSADANGNVVSRISDKQISLSGTRRSIIGRTLVIHADPDDYGDGNFPDSKTTGHAGARVCCGIIGLAKPMLGVASVASNHVSESAACSSSSISSAHAMSMPKLTALAKAPTTSSLSKAAAEPVAGKVKRSVGRPRKNPLPDAS